MGKFCRALLVTAAATFGLASNASADLGLEGPASIFDRCPVGAPVPGHGPLGSEPIGTCVNLKTTSGELRIGNTVQQITKPIDISFGFYSGTEGEFIFVPPADGQPIRAGAENVPGGLLGIRTGNWLLDRLLQSYPLGVTATTQAAGPIDFDPFGVTKLPIKVKLDNPLLGPNCYLGSNANPIVLNLTQDFTNVETELIEAVSGLTIKGVVASDDSFAVPRSSGCGGALGALIGPVVDAKLGLPSASGRNKATMNTDASLAAASDVAEAAGVTFP